MEENTTNQCEQTQSAEIGELVTALAKAQGQMTGARKSADNPFFKSKYADLHECIETAREPLSKNNLAVIQTTESCDNGIVVVTTLAHASGQWIRGKIKMNPKKDDDQGRGSSITYARRYTFAAIVGLAQMDDDGNKSCGNSKKTTPEKSLDKRFSDALDVITGKVNEKITADEFDTFIDSISEHFSIFKGKMKKDIEVSISDTRAAIEEKNAD